MNNKLFYSLPFLVIAASLGVDAVMGVGESSIVSVNDDNNENVVPVNNKPTNEKLGFHGEVEFIVHDKNGIQTSYEKYSNLIVHEGLNTALDLMFPDINLNGNATDNKFDVIRIGIGTTNPANGDTDIETAIGGCLGQQDATVTGGAASGGVAWAYVSVQFAGADCTGTITESVLANSITGGEILSRLEKAVGTTIGSGDTLTVNWNVTATDTSGT